MIALTPEVEMWTRGFIERERLPISYLETVRRFYGPLASRVERLIERSGHVPVVGINGGQGTGKSTCSALLAGLLKRRGFRALVLSIDDFYHPKAARRVLAEVKHPLLATRGVPGTHDMELFQRVVAAARGDAAAGESTIPRFDKANDDRAAEGAPFPAEGVDVILFEGWCVGAAPEPRERLSRPLNELERERDPDGAWRGFVNEQLAGDYAQAFGLIDYLVMLRPPNFEVIHAWRGEQEAKLRAKTQAEGRSASALMNEEELAAFIAHYERLTRWMLAEMPERADERFDIDADHEVSGNARAPSRYLISTDLDASLLDGAYDWRAALPALEKCAELDAVLVLNSSKTIREMKRLAAELSAETGVAAPILVAENGGALATPKPGGGYQVACLGRERSSILSFAHAARAKRGYAFEGFADWTPEEVMRLTGLSRAAAGMAMDRESTEPILWIDSDARWKDFLAELEAEGLRAIRGGRFTHLMGRTDKAYGLRAALALARESDAERAWTVVALGDSPNDAGMLDAADIAVVIPNPEAREGLEPVSTRRVFAPRPGPEGWNEAVLTILNENA